MSRSHRPVASDFVLAGLALVVVLGGTLASPGEAESAALLLTAAQTAPLACLRRSPNSSTRDLSPVTRRYA